jgi:hypothetical protein
MLNQIFRFGQRSYLRWLFILWIKFGIEYVFSNDDANSVQDTIEDVNIVGNLCEIVLQKIESEIGDCFGNDL